MIGPSKRRNDDLEHAPAKRRDDIFLRLSDRVPFVGGSELSISGKHLSVVIIALAALIVALVLGFVHDSRAEDQHTDILRHMAEQTKVAREQAEATTKLAGAINLNTYVLSLPESKRLALDLAEPAEIRKLREYREWRERQR